MTLERVSIEVTHKRAETLQILRYDCSQDGLHPYQRTLNPTVPATVEDPERAMGRPLPAAPRFAEVCFRHKRLLQPLRWLPRRTGGSRENGADEDGVQRKSETPEP
jgi:hypothetical protein